MEQKTSAKLSSAVNKKIYEQNAEFGISILFQYFVYIFTKFNIFSRSWKLIFKFNPISIQRGKPVGKLLVASREKHIAKMNPKHEKLWVARSVSSHMTQQDMCQCWCMWCSYVVQSCAKNADRHWGYFWSTEIEEFSVATKNLQLPPGVVANDMVWPANAGKHLKFLHILKTI